jgi:phosphoserine phosphatase
MLREKIFTQLAARRDLAVCFKRFANLQILPRLYRPELFKFLTEKSATDRVVVLTANYASLVRASLREKDASASDQFLVIGTALPQISTAHPPITKGKEKVEALETFFREYGLSRERVHIHNFFDGYSDRFLVEIADQNVLVSRSKKKRSFFSRISECTDLDNYLRVHAL